MQAQLEEAVTAALSTARARRRSSGDWDHSAVSVDRLQATLQQLRTLPMQLDEAGVALTRRAELVIALRSALLAADPAKAASWGDVVEVLERPETEQFFNAATDIAEEIGNARHEFKEIRKATEAALAAALEEGRSQRPADGGPWSHQKISDLHVRVALAELVCRCGSNPGLRDERQFSCSHFRPIHPDRKPSHVSAMRAPPLQSRPG